ncbi:MAG TPA: 2,3-epoxybenzoyl-CoA dihydrolase [Acidimicrobiia bacterium]|nr:2,3-epoxybenzoyl-CoA dihydrolase [Acidimicrobiia bacterium]
MIDFQTHPDDYRHWRLQVVGRVAYLNMAVDANAGLHPGYELKLNSYDLGVDIELADAVQRLRFEHPAVGAVVIGSQLDRVFCAGANIGMLAGAAHALKVNFCKFTNETRTAIEDATANSAQRYIAAVNGNAAGGGYELALATDHIMLVDDRSASVSLPEVPLLGVLPGTGGLTRLTDKRHVRRDRADIFCTLEEGIKGSKALEWGLVDELVPAPSFAEVVADRAFTFAEESPRPVVAEAVSLTPLERDIADDAVIYSSVSCEIDRSRRTASIVLRGPTETPPVDGDEAVGRGAEFWPLRLARELDDLILHLRVNELEIGTLLLRSEGDLDVVLAHDAFSLQNIDHWFVNEVTLHWARVLRRLDMTSRTIIALVEPGSCFGGMLADLTLAADRSYMLEGSWSGEGGATANLAFTETSRGRLPMANGLSRLATRFWGNDEGLDRAEAAIGEKLDAVAAAEAGLVTDIMDDLDWDDELRMLIEERAAFSPDGLTGLEANLRFVGPETMDTKIFGRLTAWQNWVFQRPNASGESGALRRYGTGIRPEFDPRRV